VIVSGDFKVDYTPIDGQVTDLQTFARYGERGVMAFIPLPLFRSSLD